MALHLVTGGCGFLGSFIVRELLRQHQNVRIVDLIDDTAISQLADFHQVDVLDRAGIANAMRGVEFVHHEAALVPLKKAGDRFWQVNVEGTRTVYEEALKAGVRHFSHMSSSAVFGNVTAADCPIGLNPPNLHPVEIYGRSKAAAESIVAAGMDNPKMPCAIIRPRTIIGTERLGIFQILFEWISEGRNIYIIGDGSNQFQFAHVEDLVNVSIETSRKCLGGYFNIGTDRFETLRESLQTFCDLVGTGSRVRSIPYTLAASSLWLADKLRLSPLGPWHYLTYHKPYYFDLKPMFERLEWRPKYSNIEMLQQSYNWYCEHRGELDAKKSASAHRGTLKQGVLRILKAIS